MLHARIDLVDDLRAPRAARRATRVVLEGWGHRDAEALAAVELVVTELVTNVLRHAAGSPFRLELEQAGALRVAVVDGSAVVPVARELDHEQESGRGMRLVAELADAWGSEDLGGGKRVWVLLPLPLPLAAREDRLALPAVIQQGGAVLDDAQRAGR